MKNYLKLFQNNHSLLGYVSIPKTGMERIFLNFNY